ncbi:L,D-transpeptidase family protein [Streptomyces pathocidini]|uniref:L,D-transpeptidase family protein n=1 Tax=Streptomyces pathocidini TaxID=1650571 RepID=UPI0033D4739D
MRSAVKVKKRRRPLAAAVAVTALLPLVAGGLGAASATAADQPPPGVRASGKRTAGDQSVVPLEALVPGIPLAPGEVHVDTPDQALPPLMDGQRGHGGRDFGLADGFRNHPKPTIRKAPPPKPGAQQKPAKQKPAKQKPAKPPVPQRGTPAAGDPIVEYVPPEFAQATRPEDPSEKKEKLQEKKKLQQAKRACREYEEDEEEYEECLQEELRDDEEEGRDDRLPPCTAPAGPYQQQAEAYLGLPVDGQQSRRDCEAIRKWQEDNRIRPAVGFAGPATAGVMRLIQARANPNAEGKCPVRDARVACVDLPRQLMWVQAGRDVVFGPVPIRSGKPGYPTRTGWHQISSRSRDHVSTIYHSPMPFAQFFAGGQAFHGVFGNIYDPTEGSYGCVNLRYDEAAGLWDILNMGSPVYVWGRRPGT